MAGADRVLAELNKTAGVRGSAYISKEGLPLAAALPPDAKRDEFTYISAVAFGSGLASIESLDLGNMDIIDVRGSKGKVLIAAVEDNLIAVITEPDAMLGEVRMAMRTAAKELTKSYPKSRFSLDSQ